MIERPGYIDKVVKGLSRSPIVALLGPRQCGKTTLARMICRGRPNTYFDLESQSDLRRLANPEMMLGALEGLVVIDEIQTMPELFAALRVIVDKPENKCRFLILGSASPHIIRDVSETLAGRVEFVDMVGFDLTELGMENWKSLWIRGGFPRSFLADNDQNNQEQIFSIAFDGNVTRTYGGTNFIIHAAIGGGMNPSDFGCGGGWGGTRTTGAFVDKFPDETGDIDGRAMFYTNGQNKEILNIGEFTDGYAITKWKNVTSTGSGGKSQDYPDTDFPLFRLADIYLMYAEAAVRGAADIGTAVTYVNMIRERAYGDQGGNITTDDLDLDFILDERGRELYWECHRRTDLVRFGKFTGSGYLWPWKGNVADGTGTNAKYNLFPIPASDIGANQNLIQNDGY